MYVTITNTRFGYYRYWLYINTHYDAWLYTSSSTILHASMNNTNNFFFLLLAATSVSLQLDYYNYYLCMRDLGAAQRVL